MNNNKSLDDMLWVFLPYVVKLVAEAKNIDMEKAVKFIYTSRTYKMLENKNCKLWYYPDKMLADFFVQEYDRAEMLKG